MGGNSVSAEMMCPSYHVSMAMKVVEEFVW